MRINIDPNSVAGLGTAERQMLQELLDIYKYHIARNEKKDRYYEGNIPLNSVNLGIALPKNIGRLEIGCAWGANAVDVLAGRSMFDGFVGAGGGEATELNAIVRDNRLIAEYPKACIDELKYGCTFATLSADTKIGCKIRWHSPMTAAAKWDGERGRIAYGMAVIATERNRQTQVDEPRLINLYTDDAIWQIVRNDKGWRAVRHPHQMGRPLMEPLVWNATSGKPFGRSRIKDRIRKLIDGYIRTIANATIGLEFATSPQKYLLGVTDEQYDAIVDDKFRQYVGAIIAATTNPETGEKPTFGQLPQGNITPHVEMLRALSTQFSAATGLSVTDTGVVNDANPTSSDAILAQTQTLVGKAEKLNEGNGEALRTIALMATAICNKTTMEKLTEEQRDVMAHFRNPARPNVAVTADAAVKIASARQSFAQTDVFLEMLGFDQADVRRIKAQEQRARGLALFDNLTEDEPNADQ